MTTKYFYRHISNGDIYAIEIRWDGLIVGSAGPFADDTLRPLDDYNYRPDRNAWLQSVNDKLILFDAPPCFG